MATRKVKAQNPESWKSEASRCLRSFHRGLFLTHSSSAQRFHIKDVLTVQKNQVRLFFFYFFFLLRDESDLTRIIFHHLHSVFFFFFTRRRHVPRHLQRVLPHGVPQPREAEAKECALPTLLQVVPPSCLQGNKDIYLKSAATTFHIVTVWGGWHLTNVEKADHLFITCLFGFLFAQKKKKSPFKVDQSEEILILWCCRSCVEQLHESCAVKKNGGSAGLILLHAFF